jgi:crotonobetainyl-CoA:carnitine CoA-transferase CaiB-like acyl-CoA transferase
VFHARDGDVMVAAANDGLFGRLCEALDLPELASDLRFATNPDRIERRDELAALIQARVAGSARDDVLGRLAAAGVPAAPVNDIGQVAEHEQTTALGLIQQTPEPTVALPLSFDGERARHRSAPPRLGEHTAEILREAGYDDGQIAALAREGIVRDGRLAT